MSLIKRLSKKIEVESVENAPNISATKNVGRFSNMADGGVPQREIKDNSNVNIYCFEDEENLTEEQWEQLSHLVMLGNPEGEYIATKTENNN